MSDLANEEYNTDLPSESLRFVLNKRQKGSLWLRSDDRVINFGSHCEVSSGDRLSLLSLLNENHAQLVWGQVAIEDFSIRFPWKHFKPVNLAAFTFVCRKWTARSDCDAVAIVEYSIFLGLKQFYRDSKRHKQQIIVQYLATRQSPFKGKWLSDRYVFIDALVFSRLELFPGWQIGTWDILIQTTFQINLLLLFNGVLTRVLHF